MTHRIPTLETDRLVIRELTMDDLETLNRIMNDAFDKETPLEDTGQWLRWTVLGYEMFARLDQPHYGERGITLKDRGELIGAIGIVPYIDSFAQFKTFTSRSDERATAEVGLFWAVAPVHQGQGYATEAARAIVDYLFEHQNLGRIIATTGPNNMASQAVMRKIGMTVEHASNPKPGDIKVVGVLDRMVN